MHKGGQTERSVIFKNMTQKWLWKEMMSPNSQVPKKSTMNKETETPCSHSNYVATKLFTTLLKWNNGEIRMSEALLPLLKMVWFPGNVSFVKLSTPALYIKANTRMKLWNNCTKDHPYMGGLKSPSMSSEARSKTSRLSVKRKVI